MKEIEKISNDISLTDWDKLLRKGKYFFELDKKVRAEGISLKAFFKDATKFGGLKYNQATKLLKVALNESEMKIIYNEGFKDLNLLIKEFNLRHQSNSRGGPKPSGLINHKTFEDIGSFIYFKIGENWSNDKIHEAQRDALISLKSRIQVELNKFHSK